MNPGEGGMAGTRTQLWHLAQVPSQTCRLLSSRQERLMEGLTLGPSLEEECMLDCGGTNVAPLPQAGLFRKGPFHIDEGG